MNFDIKLKIKQNSSKLLWLAIGLYAVAFSVICLWKYSNFLYGGLDLAIINNVFWNVAHGNGFWSSIQGHSYLGDHFTPILVLLLPIYYLWQSPEILLILQSLFLALAAWPIYKIAKLKLNKNLALGIALLWLVNPLVHNINLFEFHFIALLPFFFLMAFYYYLKKRRWPFFVFIFLCLLIREDIAFIILALGIIILISNLKNKFLILNSCLLILASAIWAVASAKIISVRSLTDFSPFFYYYNWFGSANLSRVLNHILSYTNLEMIVGFLLPFLFMPLVRPKWLLLALAPLGQIVLSQAGGGAQVWQMHYGALFLPALVVAFIYSYQKANDFIEKKFGLKNILITSLIVVNVFLWFSFGRYDLSKNENAIDLSEIEKNASVMASFDYLANLSSRSKIYSLHYSFLGVQQFAQAPYVLNEKPKYIILDKGDYEYYDKILKTSAWAGVHYINGYKRLDELLKNYNQIEAQGDISLFKLGF